MKPNTPKFCLIKSIPQLHLPQIGGIWDLEMISSDFANKLSNFPEIKKHFQGVFSADNLPKSIKKNHFIICNTDILKGTGKHWYTVVKLQNDCLEYFDSLGVDNIKKAFIQNNFHQKGITKVKFNVTQVQASTSSTCGLFVLFFIVNRYHNQDLNFTDLLNELFVQSHSQNEEVVNSFINLHF